MASSVLACTNKGNACIWYSSLCTVHTQTHTPRYHLLSVLSLRAKKCWEYWCTSQHNTLLLNLVGVPSTNVDLKEQAFLQLIVLNGEWVELFVLPEVIRKKSIPCCQNHLPRHPHFLPRVALSLPLSLSLTPAFSSLSRSFCSVLFYTLHVDT